MSTVQFIFVIAVVFIQFFVSAFISLFFFNRRKKSLRSPITDKILRGPGETLRNQVDIKTEGISTALFTTFIQSAVMLLFLLAGIKFTPAGSHLIFFYSWIVLYFVLTAWTAKGLYRLLRERQDLFLGLDAELAVGNELNQLMLQGYHVYHDFQADNFNIDHIVIGPVGVFAVETKGRPKKDGKEERRNVEVKFDGEKLIFPDKIETEPIEQAKRQAKWLSNWISKAVAAEVNVIPAIALSGWYTTRAGRYDLFFYNGKNPENMIKNRHVVLSGELVQRVSHQIEQRCRDVKPLAYGKD